MNYRKVLIAMLFCFAFISASAQVKVYKGLSSYSSDVLFNIKDGKLYDGNSSYSSDVFANKQGLKVYKNNSNYSSDVDFTLSGDVTIEQFVAIWYAVKYCW